MPVRFSTRLGAAPDHWATAGPRTSRIDRQWPRRAITPAHALLNFAYAMLETEAVIAAQAIGFDPSLGLMLSRVPTCATAQGFATDLMEPEFDPEMTTTRNHQAVLQDLSGVSVSGIDELLNLGIRFETKRGVRLTDLARPWFMSPPGYSGARFRSELGPHAEQLSPGTYSDQPLPHR